MNPDLRLDKSLGYLYFIDRTHPLANKQGKVYYHRCVASTKVGRWLSSAEHVHHIDGNRSNNDPSNLEVLTAAEHASTHSRIKQPTTVEYRQCANCETVTKNRKYCSPICASNRRRKITRPSKETLQRLLDLESWSAVGRRFGVSDNAVRKWAKLYKLI